MRIAITGGIAEGKSTVLDIIARAGIKTASADVLGAEVLARDSVQEAIGVALDIDIPLNRKVLRERITHDESARHAVNAITHPLIWEALADSEAVFFEVPLLVETCLVTAFDRVWVVTCGETEQRRRLIERTGNEDQAWAILGTQLPTRSKIPFADQVIRTNQERETVERDVLACLHAQHLL